MLYENIGRGYEEASRRYLEEQFCSQEMIGSIRQGLLQALAHAGITLTHTRLQSWVYLERYYWETRWRLDYTISNTVNRSINISSRQEDRYRWDRLLQANDVVGLLAEVRQLRRELSHHAINYFYHYIIEEHPTDTANDEEEYLTPRNTPEDSPGVLWVGNAGLGWSGRVTLSSASLLVSEEEILAVEAARREVEKKAFEWLFTTLSPVEQQEFRQHATITVRGPSSGLYYTIHKKYSNNISVHKRKGDKPKHYLCIVPKQNVPIADQMLAIKLLIETDESKFRSIAQTGFF